MFMQTTLSKKSAMPNRRTRPGRKVAPGAARNSGKAGKSVTDGHNPHYGTRKKTDKTLTLPGIAPWKMILTSFLIGICGFFYITHVFSTQQLLEEVQQLENEFNRTSRVHAETRLAYDRMIGPREVYQRAREQGFVNAGPADQVIILK